eukprot:TRINITY_DN11649_c0_g2_i3.p1 TRINITY_DN11649_c0_g2~~TRINITY_DN11649_c0_g2_i3.p1  ORF type:complete len:1110 (-),score=277.81 TRINITY_DN11649_c0_g2_i3:74-3403(-)
MASIQEATDLLAEAQRHVDEEEYLLAEEKCERALAFFRSQEGLTGQGPGVADTVRTLALCRSACGQRKAALGLVASELSAVRSRGNDRRAEAVLLLAQAETGNSRCGSRHREEALQAALQALEIFRELGDKRLEGWALIALGHTHVQRGTKRELPEEMDRAIEVALQAESILRDVGDKVGQGKAMHTTAVALSFQNNVDEAVARSRELVQHWRDLGYSRLQVFQNECVSEWELARHRPEEALEAAQAALDAKLKCESEGKSPANATEGHRIPGRSATSLIHASNAYLTMGRAEEAVKLSQQRLEQFQRTGDFESEVLAQSALIAALSNEDKLEEAGRLGVAILEKIRSRPQTRQLKCWELEMQQTLARNYLRARDLDRADATIKELMDAAEAGKDRKTLASVWSLKSEAALAREEFRLALKAAMKSRDLCRKVGSKKGEASALLSLCSAYCARGELKRGAAVTVEAQRLFASVADREGEADALRMQADVRLHLNDFTRAIAAARRCRELHRELGCRQSEAWSCVQLTQALIAAATEEERQEMERREKAKAEKGKASSVGDQDWFAADEDEDGDQERPGKAAFERALQAAKDTLKLSRPQKDELLLVRALISLAGAHFMNLEPDSASKLVDEGLPLAQKCDDKSAIGHFSLLKAQLLEHQGPEHVQEAKQHANKALQCFRELEDSAGEDAANKVISRLTPKTIGTRPEVTGSGAYGLGDDMEEYWEEEVIEEGGALQAMPYKGPSSEEVSSTISDVALSLIGVDSLDADEPLMDAGLDSLAAVEFGNTIAKEFVGITLPSTLMFDYPSVKLLAQFIDTTMREAHEQSQASAALQNASGGQRRTRMVKKFRPRPGGARKSQLTGPSQHMGMAPVAVNLQPEPYKGPSSAEITSSISEVALSLIGVDTIDADEPLMDAGLDSLAAVEFGNTIAKEFVGISLPSTLMFDFPSVKLLSQFIDAGLRESHEQKEAERVQQAQQVYQQQLGDSRGGYGGYSPHGGFQQPQQQQQVVHAPAAAQVAAKQPYSGPSLPEIADVVKDTALSLIGVDTIDDDEPLMDAGLDSLAAVEFGQAISKDFVGLALPATLMFDFPSVKSLTNFIDAGLREAHENS